MSKLYRGHLRRTKARRAVGLIASSIHTEFELSQGRKTRILTVALGAAALATAGAAWMIIHAGASAYTDNAYVMGELTAVAPKVGGYVVALEVTDNQPVTAGQTLFRIDPRDFEARVEQARANVDAAQARLVNVDAEIDLQRSAILQAEAQQAIAVAGRNDAVRTFNRLNTLGQNHVVSQSNIDSADAAREQAEAGVVASGANVMVQTQKVAVLAAQRKAALSAISQARAAMDLAQLDLERTTVRAPIDGVVGSRHVRLGQLAVPGSPLIDLVPVTNIWLVANFKETQVGGIRRGQRAYIRVDAYPDEVLQGTVDSFAPGSGAAFSLLPADNATGNFIRVVQRVPVKIILDRNPLPGRIVPGLSARVEIAGAENGEVAPYRPSLPQSGSLSTERSALTKGQLVQ